MSSILSRFKLEGSEGGYMSVRLSLSIVLYCLNLNYLANYNIYYFNKT